jgi:hypothetical protein
MKLLEPNLMSFGCHTPDWHENESMKKPSIRARNGARNELFDVIEFRRFASPK